MRSVAVVAGLAVSAWILVLLGGQLPSGTRGSSLALRAFIALVIGGALITFVWRALRSMTEAPPPPPQTVDATSADVVYECPVCGTRVRLEVAATTKAPKHCGEEMEPKLLAR